MDARSSSERASCLHTSFTLLHWPPFRDQPHFVQLINGKSLNMPSTQSSRRNQPPTSGSKREWLQTRPGERCLIRVSAADTNGAYSVVEIVAEAGDSTPIHVHQNEDEHFYILEGAARIAYWDERFDAAAGETVNLRRGVPHAWGNASASPLRMVVIASPGGCEEALRIIAKGGDIDFMALSKKFNIRNVGPPLLGDRH
jgi:quercetin dioxygenase-like cupin family protein